MSRQCGAPYRRSSLEFAQRQDALGDGARTEETTAWNAPALLRADGAAHLLKRLRERTHPVCCCVHAGEDGVDASVEAFDKNVQIVHTSP
jgi:phosphoglycolate phosphatase-like HAD superfamily hydrolase